MLSLAYSLQCVNKRILVHIVLEPKCMLSVCLNFISEHLKSISYPSFCKKLLKSYLPSKTIPQWILDENISERCLLHSYG